MKLKVWGGYVGGNGRAIIATLTKKKAIEILRERKYISANYFNNYFTETGNDKEIALAELNEDTLIFLPKNFIY